MTNVHTLQSESKTHVHTTLYNDLTKGLVKVGPGFPAPVPFWVPKG